MINTVLFDMGGTLEDIFADAESEKQAAQNICDMLAGYGLDPQIDGDEMLQRVKEGWRCYGTYRDSTNIELKPEYIWCDYLLRDFGFPREKLVPHCEELAHMWEVTNHRRQLRPRVKEMLEALRGAGIKLGIISNTAAMYQVFDSLEKYGIRDYFQDVTLSSVTGIRKPSPEIFNVALHQVRSVPEECVYVGDTVSRDVIGSKRAGFAVAIQIGSKLTKEKDQGVVHEYEPDYVIEDIYEVYTIVRNLLNV